MAKLLDKMLNMVGWEIEDDDEEEKDQDEGMMLEKKPLTEEDDLKPKFSLNYNKKNQNKVVSLSSNQVRVVVVQPESIDDAQEISNHLKDKKPVIVNLESMEKEAAQRIVDFFCGAVYALDGSIYRVSATIFLLAPFNVDVTGDFKDELRNKGVFPWMN